MLFSHDQHNMPEKWSAICGEPGGIGLAVLNVFGVFNLPSPCHEAELTLHARPGPNPSMLLLDLTIRDNDHYCTQVITPTPVGFSMALSDCDRYDEVHIIGIAQKIPIKKY